MQSLDLLNQMEAYMEAYMETYIVSFSIVILIESIAILVLIITIYYIKERLDTHANELAEFDRFDFYRMNQKLELCSKELGIYFEYNECKISEDNPISKSKKNEFLLKDLLNFLEINIKDHKSNKFLIYKADDPSNKTK